jgi:asparaginyl-tRNA synthetase
MTDYTTIQDAMDKGEGQVSLQGWAHRERGSNKLKFILLRDHTNLIQCVIDRNNFEEQWDEIDHIQIETSLRITGTIVKDERAPTGYEVQVTNLEIVGKSDNFPIGKDFSVEFLADNRHLWLRSRKMSSMMKIRSTIFGAIHEYFRMNKFIEYQSYKLFNVKVVQHCLLLIIIKTKMYFWVKHGNFMQNRQYFL